MFDIFYVYSGISYQRHSIHTIINHRRPAKSTTIKMAARAVLAEKRSTMLGKFSVHTTSLLTTTHLLWKFPLTIKGLLPRQRKFPESTNTALTDTTQTNLITTLKTTVVKTQNHPRNFPGWERNIPPSACTRHWARARGAIAAAVHLWIQTGSGSCLIRTGSVS